MNSTVQIQMQLKIAVKEFHYEILSMIRILTLSWILENYPKINDKKSSLKDMKNYNPNFRPIFIYSMYNIHSEITTLIDLFCKIL